MLFLVAGAGMNFWLLQSDPRSTDYLRVWAFGLPLNIVLSIAMGMQAYGRSLETSPRVRRLSHTILLSICAVAAIVAQLAQDTYTPYGVLSRIDHGVSAALGLFCLGMLPLLQHYYSPRRRPNAVAQEWILTVYYLGNALMLLATHWQLYPFNRYLHAATIGGCCVAWAFCLKSTGEELPPRGTGTGSERLEKLEAEAQFDALANKVKSAASSK